MARIDIKTEVQGPDEIRINLVREDYLETSNTFRIFFEICLAISCAVFGSLLSFLNDSKEVPLLNWIFLIVMIIGSSSFLILSIKNYKKARSQTGIK